MPIGRIIAFVLTTLLAAVASALLGIDEQTPLSIPYRTDNPAEADRYFYNQRVYPYRTVPEGWRAKAQEHIDQMEFQALGKSSVTSWSWLSLGPVNIAGRLRSLALDPDNSQILYAGSAGGGIWKSTNGGMSWVALDEFLPNLRIGSIAVSPHDNKLILAGNGEGFVFWNGGIAYGRGIYKSTDAGASWKTLQNTDNSEFEFVFDIAFDPFMEASVLASTGTGIYRSMDDGVTWTPALQWPTVKRGMMSVFSQTNPGLVYAALEGIGIYVSTDHGENWTFVKNNDINSLSFNRIYLAAAPSDGRIIYAAVTQLDMTCGGVFRSSDAGTTWEELAIPMNELLNETYMGQQGMYNSVLTVHPQNPDIIYAGGIDLYKSTNAGRNWIQVSIWFQHQLFPYVHADQHAILFNPDDPEFLYIGNDGGLFVTSDGGRSFSGRNHGLNTTQLHSGTPHPYADIVLAGTIDNGNMKIDASVTWELVTGGDGGSTAINYNDPSVMYSELYYLHILKSTEGGEPNTFKIKMNGIPRTAGIGTSDRVNFIAPLVMDPNDPDLLYAGTYRLYKSNDGAESWSPISPDISGGSVLSAIGLSRSDSRVIYAGAVNGTMTFSSNGGANWIRRSTGLPNRYITDIEVHPGKSSTAYITVSGFGSGHLYKTTNYGAVWTNNSGLGLTKLPDVPANTIAIHPGNDSLLFVGTDVGLFYSEDAGSHWRVDNQGIGNTIIADLQFRKDTVLFAATHGRGQYRTRSALSTTASVVPQTVEVRQNYPNPVPAGINQSYINYKLPLAMHVRINLYDSSGRRVRSYDQGLQAGGSYSFAIETQGLSSGLYIYAFSADEFSETKKMLVLQ